MQGRPLAALFVLGAIWGASFMFMRIAAPEFGIYPLVLIRAFLAAIVLVPFVFYARAWRDVSLYWREIAIVGVVNTAVPFVLFNYSSLHLQAGVNAILNATAPMFAVIVAWVWLGDKITRIGMVGLALGFAGVIIISLQKTAVANISVLPILTALGATACYGIAASYIKKRLGSVNPLALAAGSQIFACVVLLPPSLVTFPTVMPSSSAWLSAIILAIFGTGLAYVLYFYLIAKAGPSKAIMVGYMVPLFGVLWGILFLREALSYEVLFGGGLILAGVMLATGFLNRWFKSSTSK